LKAYAIAQGERLKKVHDLTDILEQCLPYDPEFNTLSDICASLTDYAVASKYPYYQPEITQYDMDTALKDAKTILEFTKRRLIDLGYVN